METDLNEENDPFFETAGNVVWSLNPLYGDKKEIDVSDYKDENENIDCARENIPRIESESESGYSETLCSELSSPDNSMCSNVSYSDADEGFLSDVTESMRKAGFLITSGADRDLVSTDLNSPQIISAKGTVRGVKNRVRDNIRHFLSDQPQNEQKDEDLNAVDPEHGKVIMYTTSLGLIRSTQDECRYVRRMFHNLMVRVDERDLFVHPHFKQNLQDRLNGEEIHLPQVFINGERIGGAKEVETLIETGTIKDYLDKIEHVSHSEACSSCGGLKFINCSKCSGSGKSRITRISREINSLKCSSCTNGIVSCPLCNS